MKDFLTKTVIFTIGFIGVALYQIVRILTRPNPSVPYDVVREDQEEEKKTPIGVPRKLRLA